jgi:predicted nucleic acid-binding protein
MLYLDSSALVKCYGEETGALDTVDLIDAAEMVATSLITRVEVSSALARAVREGLFTPRTGRETRAAFGAEWEALIQVPVTGRVLARAEAAVWDFGLRGYDAVQLASALIWQERVGQMVTLATFDVRLALAAASSGITAWPASGDRDAIPLSSG